MSKIWVTGALIISSVLGLSSTFAYAGPCTVDIAKFETRNPMAGITARQSVDAQLHRQPTSRSLKQASESLQSEFSATMADAKRLDAEGDRAGCTRALNAAKEMKMF
jgi:hypothetical protein